MITTSTIEMSKPILCARSRSNSLSCSQTDPQLQVCVEQSMGSFIPQFPSFSDSIKALSKPDHHNPEPGTQSLPIVWWNTIKRTRPRTPSLYSIPALSRAHSPEPHTVPEPDSPLPQTPSSLSVSLPHPLTRISNPLSEINPLPPLHPSLANLESKSMLKRLITCSVCQKLGDDYPRCGRCGVAWCSRACRIGSLGQDPLTGRPLKKHIC